MIAQPVHIRYSDIPDYLRSSAFHSGLVEEDVESAIEVLLCKLDDTVHNFEDFSHLLKTMVFWGLDEIPESVLDFCASHPAIVWEPATVELPDNGTLHTLLKLYFSRSIIPAIKSGRRAVVLYWMKANPFDSVRGWGAVHDAASTGDVQWVQELCEVGYFPCEDSKGFSEIERKARQNGYTGVSTVQGYPYIDAYVAAVHGGHVECLRYLLSLPHKNRHTRRRCLEAVRHGQLECLKMLRAAGHPWDIDQVCSVAASAGHLDCLEYCHQEGCVLTAPVAWSTHHECVRYALAHGCPTDRNTCYQSVRGDAPVECLQALRESGAVWDESVSIAAVEKDISILKYALENACPHYDFIIQRAAQHCKIEHLQYLVEDQGIYADELVFSEALVRGSVECVVYLVDQGCPCHFVVPKDYKLDVKNDANIVLCVQYAAERRQDIVNATLIAYLLGKDLPLCRAYISEHTF